MVQNGMRISSDHLAAPEIYPRAYEPPASLPQFRRRAAASAENRVRHGGIASDDEA
jgi:hypothetical protein